MPLWLSVVWPVIFALGAGVCFWGFKCCLVVLLPVVRRIASGSDSVICESSIWGFTYRRKTLQRPVVLVADVYESRGDWLSNMYLRAADRRRFPVTIPTAIASSKSEAKGKVDPLAKAIATRFETSITGLGQSEPRRQRVNE